MKSSPSSDSIASAVVKSSTVTDEVTLAHHPLVALSVMPCQRFNHQPVTLKRAISSAFGNGVTSMQSSVHQLQEGVDSFFFRGDMIALPSLQFPSLQFPSFQLPSLQSPTIYIIRRSITNTTHTHTMVSIMCIIHS